MVLNNDVTLIKLNSLQIGDFIEHKSGSKGIIEQINVYKTETTVEYCFQLFDGKGIVLVVKDKALK
ncbi:hypothetical protein ACFOWA_03450 [Pedobacter lithocola]|uniref:DUF4926 domain-containing protein n=1 Tax=Pedobacter lithocola TaxID=1908239 RepID=A0ABV8P828_9SPHI